MKKDVARTPEVDISPKFCFGDVVQPTVESGKPLTLITAVAVHEQLGVTYDGIGLLGDGKYAMYGTLFPSECGDNRVDHYDYAAVVEITEAAYTDWIADPDVRSGQLALAKASYVEYLPQSH